MIIWEYMPPECMAGMDGPMMHYMPHDCMGGMGPQHMEYMPARSYEWHGSNAHGNDAATIAWVV